MTVLVAKVLAIETSVHEIRSIVTRYCVQTNQTARYTRSHSRRGNQAPSWVDKISHKLDKLSLDLKAVKQEIHTKSLDSGHGQTGDEALPILGRTAGSQQGDRDKNQPDLPPAPAQEPSKTTDCSSLQSQPATEQPATRQNTPALSLSTDPISPRPDTESSTSTSRNSGNSITALPPTNDSSISETPISETALSRNAIAVESTERESSSHAIERLSLHEPASTAPSLDESGLCNAPIFCCAFADFFKHNEDLFKKICGDEGAQEHGYARLEIKGLPPLNFDEKSTQAPTKNHAVHFRYKPDDASVNVSQVSKRGVTLPKFPLPETAKENWSRERLKAFVEATLKYPPEEAVYIIGEQTFPYNTLSPGEKLKRRGGGNLPGINTAYQYFNASGAPSITIIHCEDAGLGSKNVLLCGENKVLLVVKPSSNKNFEDRMYERFPRVNRDSQGIRHLARAILPSLLDGWGVEYDIASLAPGQGFATLPGTVYHMVVNMGDNLALAVNWEQPSSPDMPEGYVWCSRSCDPLAITADIFQLSDHPPPVVRQEANVTRKRTQDTSPTARKTPKLMPKCHEVEAQADKPQALKELVLSTNAIVHHIARVRAFRSWDASMKDRLRSSRSAGEADIDRLIQDCEGGELLQRFLKRLMQVRQEQEIKARMKTQNLERATPAIIKEVLRWRGWPDTDEYRTKLRQERKQSARLEKICSGKNRGLLCFLPHEDSPFHMADGDLKAFLSLIRRHDMVSALCRIGADFEESILGNGKVPIYALEDKSLAEVEQLSPEGRLALLAGT